MKIDEKVVRRVAANSRLELTDKEVKEFAKDMQEILNAFSAISKVDTKKTASSLQPIDLRLTKLVFLCLR